jgi:hypothetical protein
VPQNQPDSFTLHFIIVLLAVKPVLVIFGAAPVVIAARHEHTKGVIIVGGYYNGFKVGNRLPNGGVIGYLPVIDGN